MTLEGELEAANQTIEDINRKLELSEKDKMHHSHIVTSELVELHGENEVLTQKIKELKGQVTELKIENQKQKSQLIERKGSPNQISEDDAKFRQGVMECLKNGFEETNGIAAKISTAMDKFANNCNEFANQHKASEERVTATIDRLDKLASAMNVWVNEAKTVKFTEPREFRANQEMTQKANDKIMKMTKLTYAQALAESEISFTAIRNFEIVGENDEEKMTVVQQLKRDDALAVFDIQQIEQKGATQFVLKCADEETAKKVEDQLKNKYRNAIKISMASRKLPQVELIRLNSGTTDAAEIKKQLMQQNAVLREGNFEITSVYEVRAPRGTYINAILQSNLELHNKIVDRRTLIFGFAEVRVFEHIETLQCSKCLAYGHLAGSCKAAAHCRRCAGEHLTAACLTPNATACINCANSNKRGTKYNIQHSPTDARCPIRKDRIAGLKLYHTAKN